MNARADHRLGHAVWVCGVAPGKTPFDAGMTFICLALFPRRHAHHLLAFDLGLKITAHAAVGAGGDNAALGLTPLDNAFFRQSSRRTCIHTRAATDTIRIEKILFLPRRHP